MVRLGLIEALSILLFWSLQTSQNTFGNTTASSYHRKINDSPGCRFPACLNPKARIQSVLFSCVSSPRSRKNDKMAQITDTVAYPFLSLTLLLYQSKTSMNDWILILALTVAALSSATIGIVCICCRRMEREKNRGIVNAIREQDRLACELEHARVKKEACERALRSKLKASGRPDAASEMNDNPKKN